MTHFSKLAGTSLVALALVLGGCGGSGGGGSTPAGVLITKAAGGTVTVGGASVVIPANALAADTRIVVAAQTAGLPAPPAGTVIVGGSSYDLSPNGLAFSTNATLNLTYNPANIPAGVAESALSVYTVVGGAWQLVAGGTVNATTNVASAPLAHFSVYAVISPAQGEEAPPFDIVDIGTVGGDTGAIPTSIATNGIISGYSFVAPNTYPAHAFTWHNGTMTAVQLPSEDYIQSMAFSVNSSGVVIGEAGTSNIGYGFVFDHGTDTVIKKDGNPIGWASSINDAGDFVSDKYGYIGGQWYTFGSAFETGRYGRCLNSSGMVAGTHGARASIWHNGTLTIYPKPANAVITKGYSISENGTMVGQAWSEGSGPTWGLFMKNGITTTIPPVADGGYVLPRAVNDFDQVVGDAFNGHDFNAAACLFDHGVSKDLNTMVPAGDRHLDEALGINNQGQIIATGKVGGVTRAFLLTPHVPGGVQKPKL